MNNKSILFLLVIILLFLLILCFFLFGKDSINNEEIKENNLIYEETVSPNENYVSSESEKVYYTIKVYRNDNKIIVKSSSNTPFTEELTYEIDYEQEITKNDIRVDWTTLMGDTNFTKENQIAIAIVTLSHNGEIFSQRKISFVSNAIDIIVDTVNKGD